jgi:cytochrome b561
MSIGLHWLMLALLAAVYASMELRGLFPKGSDPREALKSLHFMLGLSVLVLVLVRLVARATGPTPRIEPQPPRWQQLLATLMHVALYGLMVGLPLLGWLLLSAKGKPIPFFGLELPALIGQDKGVARQLEELHEAIATAGYFLIGLHAAAALFHHHVVRDNTLARMLPGRG